MDTEQTLAQIALDEKREIDLVKARYKKVRADLVRVRSRDLRHHRQKEWQEFLILSLKELDSGLSREPSGTCLERLRVGISSSERWVDLPSRGKSLAQARALCTFDGVGDFGVWIMLRIDKGAKYQPMNRYAYADLFWILILEADKKGPKKTQQEFLDQLKENLERVERGRLPAVKIS